MTSDRGETAKPAKFGIRHQPYARFVRTIGRRAEREIDLKALAEEIRQHGVDRMPSEVVGFLCRYLAGEIETRGRKGLTPMERKLLGRRARLLYLAVRKSQDGATDAVPEITELLAVHADDLRGKSYSPSEQAWRHVSILLYRHDGHHKILSNLVSEVAPITK